jgi:hypothetical protein
MKHLFTLLLFCLTNLFSFSQTEYKAEEFQAALMATKKGAMVIYNGQKHSFSIDIVGDSVKPSEQPNFIIVDNKILQASIIPFQSKLDFEKLSEDDQKQNLLAHKVYEMNYIKTELKQSVAMEKYEFFTFNNKVFLFWYYDVKGNEQIDKQCYLTAICFDQMLILNCPVTKGKQSFYNATFKDIKELLTNIGKTFKQNNHTIDLEKLYNDLNKQ